MNQLANKTFSYAAGALLLTLALVIAYQNLH
jgi:hypothetical protein